MPLAIPPELKKISPYIRRAEELDKDTSSPESRLVAFYCRQYAVHVGIPLTTTAAAKTCLGHILGNLEAEKPAMDAFTRDEAAFLCRKFANKVFDKADEEDRAGNADKNTAKAFYAASSFLQILEQFGDGESEVSADTKERIVYSKWKSTEILKAIKDGRKPTPGGFGEKQLGEEEAEDDSATEKKQDDHAPAPPTVEEDSDGVENVYSSPPRSPAVSSPQPPAPSREEAEEENTSDEAEEGKEIELGPPPPYPDGLSSQLPHSPLSSPRPPVDLPSVKFEFPPAAVTTPLPSPPPPKKSSGGLFGFGSKKKQTGKPTKAQISDAVELTRFALAALEDKDTELGAERLQQALEALGRSRVMSSKHTGGGKGAASHIQLNEALLLSRLGLADLDDKKGEEAAQKLTQALNLLL